MNQFQVTTRYAKVSPRKLRVLAPLVKNKPLQKTLANLEFVPKKGADILTKLLKSAVNTANQKNIPLEALKIVSYQVNEGPRLKRWLPAPRGRSYKITKKMSHVIITLSDERPNQIPNKKPESSRIRENSGRHSG